MSGPVRPPLEVTTDSGSPSGRPINTIKVSNGDLTISGTTAIIDTSGGGSGFVSGSGTSGQVAYWSASDTITGDSDLTFDGTNLSVGGYIKSGTGVFDTTGATDLTLQTNGGTSSGTIIIRDGAGQDIEITPEGSGSINLDGLKWPTADGSADQFLQTDGAGTLSFATASGGGSVGGSDQQVQWNNSGSFDGSDRFKFDSDVSGSAAMGIKNSGSAFLSSGFVAYMEGNVFIQSQVFGNEFLCSSSSSSDVGFGPQTDQNTGIAFSAADRVDLVVGGSYGLSVDSDKAILVGDDAGTSGQVLTSGGSGAAASWADASGGGSDQPNSLGGSISDISSELLGVGYNGSIADATHNAIQWANGLTRIRPHIMQQTGSLDKGEMWINAGTVTGGAQSFQLGLWNVGTNNTIGTLKCVCDISVGEGASASIVSGTWAAEAGENLNVEIGELYWVGFYGTFGASGNATSLYFFPQSKITLFPSRKTIANTTSTNNYTRFYPASAGSPQTLGDNPSVTNADTQTTATWPVLWYSVT